MGARVHPFLMKHRSPLSSHVPLVVSPDHVLVVPPRCNSEGDGVGEEDTGADMSSILARGGGMARPHTCECKG